MLECGKVTNSLQMFWRKRIHLSQYPCVVSMIVSSIIQDSTGNPTILHSRTQAYHNNIEFTRSNFVGR